MDAATERARLDAVTGSYGEGAAPFDAAMRGYMMRAFEPFWRDGPCLQVGCAHGDQTSLLARRFDDLTVMEPAAEFIAATKAKVGEGIRFVQALLEEYDEPRLYQTIVFSHVLEHVADAPDALSRLGRLLAPGGRLFVVVPNAEAPSRRIAVKMGVLDHLEALSEDDVAAGHRRVYRLDTLQHDVRASGLKVEATGGILFKPLANFQFNALIGGPLISQAFLDGCYDLGLENPSSCASIYVIAAKETP